MSHSPDELKDYLLGELSEQRCAAIEASLESSPDCRAELERLRISLQALQSLPEEAIPQRIAFVSDPVLEPSAAQKFWQQIWTGTPRLMATAAILGLVILVGIWASSPTLTRHADGWTLAVGHSPATTSLNWTNSQLREVLQEEFVRREERWLNTLQQSLPTGVDEEWVQAQLAVLYSELSKVQEDSVAGYEFVNAKHEMLKRQLFQVDLAMAFEGLQ